MTKSFTACAMAALVAVLQGCASTPSNTPSASQSPGFPDMASAWQTEGSFPELDSLRLVAAGMSKDQLYSLIGRPHFKEGVGADEWNYIFNFRTPGSAEIVTCQFKVGFENKLSRTLAWAPATCADRLKPAPVPERIVERVVERPAPAPVKSRVTLGADGLFAFGKSDIANLQPGGRAKLDDIARQLRAPGVEVNSVVVTGHTDRIGSPAANLALSRSRADSVKAYLASQGVGASVIRTVGMGDTQPVAICPGTTVAPALIACLQPNRRVDVDISMMR